MNLPNPNKPLPEPHESIGNGPYKATQEWPPKPFDKAQSLFETYTAWATGDTDKLSTIYGGNDYRKLTYYQGGALAGNADKYFWGRSNPQGTKRRHVPMAGDIISRSADLLFAKPPSVRPGEKDVNNTQLIERMDKIFGSKQWAAELHEAGESCAMLGGVYLRPWWDVDIEGHVIPSHVDADAAVPEFSFNRLKAVTFWRIASGGEHSKVYRHLERHEKGRIYHWLYCGDSGTLGKMMPLDAHYITEWAAGLVNEESYIETGLDRLDVVYWPNMRTPRSATRKLEGLAQLGKSDIDGIEPELDALDEVHTSWQRDVRNGKSRLYVDELLLEDEGPGNGGAFDMDMELMTRTKPTMSTDSQDPIRSIQFDIRWQEHAQTSAEIKQSILNAVGLSAGQFTDGPLAVGVTATEVNSRNATSESTRDKKINYALPALQEFIEIVMELDAIQFNTGIKLTNRPVVKFPTRATQSEQEQATILSTLKTSNFVSIETGVRALNPDWEEPEIEAEIKRIREDQEFDTKLAFGQGGEDPNVEVDNNAEGVPLGDVPEDGFVAMADGGVNGSDNEAG